MIRPVSPADRAAAAAATRPKRHRAHLVADARQHDETLSQFLFEERSRRSYGVTGYLVSGSGAGAISCWFAINSLYAVGAPASVLRLLLVGSGVFVLAAVVGFFAALAGYKAFDAAALAPVDGVARPYDRADRWLTLTGHSRLVAGALLAAGGFITFLAYFKLCWR